MSKFGLPQKTLISLIQVFAQSPKVKEVLIYGSRAKGNYREGSDIDLTLKGDLLDLDALYRIEEQIEQLLLPYKVDLSIYHMIENPDLIDHINRVGRPFSYEC